MFRAYPIIFTDRDKHLKSIWSQQHEMYLEASCISTRILNLDLHVYAIICAAI